jgi:hypothetical protein
VKGEPESHRFRVNGNDIGLALVHYQDPRGLRVCSEIAKELAAGGSPLILVKANPQSREGFFWLPNVVGSAAEKAGVATFDPYFDYSHPAVLVIAEKTIKTPHPKGQLLHFLAEGVAAGLPQSAFDVLGLYEYLVKGANFEIDKNKLLSRLRDFFVDRVELDETQRVHPLVIETIFELSKEFGRRLNLGEQQDAELILERLTQKDVYLSVEDFLIHILPATTDISGLNVACSDLHLALIMMSKTLGEDVASLADQLLTAARAPIEQRETSTTLNSKIGNACWIACKDALNTKLRNASGPVLIVAPGFLHLQLLDYFQNISTELGNPS